MQIDSADKLIVALRASGLFTPEQMSVVIKDLTPLKGDFQGLLRHLVNKNRITEYQLRKVIRGKAAELFIGPYIISYRIGEGGMGKVYRAIHKRRGKVYALKVVRDHLLANPLVRKRYDREVETASALNHPNIVAVFDAGEVDGRYYLAMEFVDGIDLARLSREFRPLLIPEACEYVRQASLGLQYAHDQGLVHRDIKPSNVIVSGERHIPQATEPAIVKILDMGLVRTVGFEEAGGGLDLTRAGTVVGTPDYMAPEQAKNSSGVDHRADLYSLGCTLYFLLCGQPPFPSGTAIEKLLKHQLEAPTPLQALRPEIPTEVAELVSRLLTKKPGDRIQTAAELAERLLPLAQYPQATPPEMVTQRRQNRIGGSRDHQALGSQSTVPAEAGPSSTPPDDVATQTTAADELPIAPSDFTPRPEEVNTVLHAAKYEEASPFSVMSDLPQQTPTRGINARPNWSSIYNSRDFLLVTAITLAFLGLVILTVILLR